MSEKVIKLINLYPDDDRVSISIKQPEVERQWMEGTRDKFAYRCLPLNIANQHGWAVYPKNNITVTWNGKDDLDAITVIEDQGGLATSAFGHGILTLHLPFLVRTSEDYSLYISGAPNHPIDNAHPLTGIYETDWAPYSFTMNWQLSAINQKINFTVDDPICFFFPVQRDLLESFKFVNEEFDQQEDEFRKQYYTFVMSRNSFLKGKKSDQEWQKNYFQGKLPDESKCPVNNHKTKIKLKNP